MNQFVQFIPWTDCSVDCEFCYLQKASTGIDVRQQRMKFIQGLINDNDFLSQYNRIGFIGGEIIDDTIQDIQEWSQILRFLNRQNKYVYLGANLISTNMQNLITSLSLLQRDMVCVCTSWDLEDRFNESTRNAWEYNVRWLIGNGYNVCVNVILTRRFVTAFNQGFRLHLVAPIQFLYFIPFRNDFIGQKKISPTQYRQQFITSTLYENTIERAAFLRFMLLCVEVYGTSVIEKFIDNLENHSCMFYMPIENNAALQYLDRLSNEFLPCGHLIYNLGYNDSDRCMACDAQELLASIL
jgi:hypothetical protein